MVRNLQWEAWRREEWEKGESGIGRWDDGAGERGEEKGKGEREGRERMA